MDEQMMKKDPQGFMREIRRRLGPTKIWRYEDLRQVFWLGVIRGTQSVDWTPEEDPALYLVTRGIGEVRDYLASQRVRSLVKRCLSCGRINGHRRVRCLECGGKLRYENRSVAFIEHLVLDEDPLDRIEVEQFVATLTGKMAVVARRWLLDRADLYYDNHLAQIGQELGMSAPGVAKIKRRIRESFREWRRG